MVEIPAFDFLSPTLPSPLNTFMMLASCQRTIEFHNKEREKKNIEKKPIELFM